MGWTTDKKGYLCKEVDIKAKQGTPEYSEEIFDEMHQMFAEMEAVGLEKFTDGEEIDLEEEEDEDEVL